MKLTAKQEKFARLVAEGKTQAEAYRQAYNSANMKTETVVNNAYKLMLNNDIATTIDKHKKEFTKNLDFASTITVERQLKYCQKAIQECSQKGDYNNYLKAMDMQNKLLGIYAPTKTENKTTINGLSDVIQQLNNEQL